MDPTTLVEVLQDAGASKRHGITFIEQGDKEDFLSYQDLFERSLQGLHFLQKSGLKPKDELVFQVEDNRAFIILFWSCILGGIVPVPLSIGKNNEQRAKLFNVWSILQNPYLVCTPDHLSKVEKFGLVTGQESLLARIKGKSVDLNELNKTKEQGEVYQSKPEDLAFIQFSSGSTGSPKGVMLTHENLITNVAAIANAAAYSPSDATLSWMPLTHDMGLIGFHINPVYSKMNQYLMPTNVFVRKPTLWLSKASEHQTTVICSPNFGYKYLLKYLDESKVYSWDLSSVRVIYNGAEPISESLARTFVSALTKYGLDEYAMRPVYGLAEASLAVSISDLKADIISLALDRNQLNVGTSIQPSSAENALSFVNVGTAIDDVSIKITDETGLGVNEEVIGHVKIKGKNVTSGYYNNPEATQKAIAQDGWLDTGDLGFMKGGALYITGRAKDIIFVNGQNFYPHDLERLAEAVEGVDLNKVIISGAPGADKTTEAVIAFVFHRGDISSFISVERALKAHINMETGVELDEVIPVKDIPKTTSGKLQRFKMVQWYKAGEYDSVIREMELAQAALSRAGQSKPENKTEQQLLDIWEALFGKPGLSVTDKFFEIGGNSLKAAEFAMAVLKRFEVELPLASLYDHQTIRDIAGLLDSLQKVEYSPIPKAPDWARHPASALQRRLFYFQETQADATAYNVPVAFELDTDIDADRLCKAAGQMISKYDILRSTFYEEGQELFIQVHDQVDFELDSVSGDLSDPDFATSLVTPFDLKKPGLFRIQLITNEAGKCCLFLDFHHIVMDGVSISFFVEELIRLYQGESLKTQSSQYTDYVHWSEHQWEAAINKPQKQYWLDALAGELPLLEMPLDKSRPAQFDYAGNKLTYSIGKVKAASLRDLAKKLGCSMHALMFSAYQVLLHKYTGQTELITGLPVTLRNHPDVSRSMGMFVNNLVIRHSIDPQESFETLLGRLSKQINEALTQEFPFDLLLNELPLKRDLSRNPVFDTMFLYQNMDQPTVGRGEMELVPVTIPVNTSKFDLSQEVFDGGSGALTYSFEYATALFEQDTIQKLAARYEALLDRILLNAQSKITDISLLSVEEYQDLVFGFNDSAKAFKGKSVLDLIKDQTAASPEAIAILDGQAELSYEALAEKSDLVAAALRGEGLKKGDVVALYMNRSPELIVGIVGILKAGGVFLPIDIELPQKRVQYLLSHSRCQLALCNKELEPQLSEWSGADVKVMTVAEAILAKAAQESEIAIDSGDLAYMLYTSGTTGKPKGVMVSHKALHNYASWAAETYVGNDGGSFPLFTSISFDLTLTSIFSPLVTGNTIVIYNDEPGEEHIVIRALKDNQVDLIKLTPSHLRLLKNVDLPYVGEYRLQKMILGGESLDSALAADIYEKFNQKLSLFNEYGPTEATVGCMIHQFDPEDASQTVPIGVPAANTRIYLLDEQMRLVPEGAIGEIFVSGTGLARGYWSDEKLSSQRFIQNPFVENDRVYKTGDLARRRADGLLEYLGRADEQVKINGYRIELDEINYHLRQCAGVADSVIEPQDILGRKSLIAYIIPEKGTSTLEEAALKNQLATQLPFYMIPARIVCLESFPMTGNGKLDGKALAEMTLATEASAPQLPSNELEQRFAGIWQEVLGINEVTLDDNFFELGGDSIKAVQIASRLHEKAISVQVQDLLTYHTIAQLIANQKFVLSGQKANQGIVSGVKARTPIESWFFNQDFGNAAFYNQSVLLQIDQEIDPSILQKAFESLIAQHDGLRLNYDQKARNLFFNERHLETPFEVTVFQKQDDFTSQMTALKSGFDLAESLLLKAVIFVQNGKQKHLFITAHHLITDGISWRIFLHDLSGVYSELILGNKPVLPPKTCSLVEWQCQLSTWQPKDESRSEKYWRQVEETSFALPLDYANANWSTSGLKEHLIKLDKDNTDYLIKEAHKAYRTDVFTLLNVALVRALYDWTGERSFVVEHENHGRHLEQLDVSRTMGWFTSLYPVRLELPDQETVSQVKAIKEQIKQVPDHGLSYGLEQQRTGFQNQEKRSEIRLNYLGEFSLEKDDYWSFSGLPTGPESAPENHLTTKLELNAMVMNGQLSLSMSYHPKAFRDKTIDEVGSNILSHLKGLLDQIREEEEVHFTPSDFETSLDQQELDELFM